MSVEKNVQQMDEILTFYSRVFPAGLWSFYNNLLKEGFNEESAIKLTEILFESLLPSMS